MTVRYQVCFVRSPVQVFLTHDTHQPNQSHMLFANSLENSEEYARFIQSKIFNGTIREGFVMYTSQALNGLIGNLTQNEADAEFQEPKMMS